MKKSLLSVSIGFIFLPFVSVTPAIAQNSNSTGSNSQVLLVQADPSAEIERLFEEAKKLTEQKKYQQADQKYQQILNVVTEATSADNPELAQVYFSLGVLDHRQKNLSAAKSDYEDAVRVNPQYIPAINNLGLIAYEAGEVNKAIAYWESVLESDFSRSVNAYGLHLSQDESCCPMPLV